MKKGSSIFYLISSIINGLSGFLLLSILTKNFSPKDFGEYSLITTTVSLATTVLIGWIAQSIIRFYQEYEKDNKEKYIVSTMIFSTVCMNIILGLILSVIILGISNDITRFYFVILTFLTFTPESLYLVLTSILRAKNDSRFYSISVILYTSLKLIASSFLIYKGTEDIYTLIISFAISNSLVCLVIYFFCIKNIEISFKYISFKILSYFFKYGVPLIGISAIQWILASSDRYIINLFRNSKELGLYSFSYSLASNIFNIITTFLLLTAYPLIIKEYNNSGRKGASESVSSHLRYYFILVIPVFFGLTSLSSQLIKTFSSSAYLDGQITLIITSLGTVIFGMTFYFNKSWELEKQTKVIFLHSLYVGILNILLNFLFVPTYGYEAAAYSTLISYIVYFMITYYKSRRVMYIKINYLSLFRISLSSILMFMIVTIISKILLNSLINLLLLSLLGMIIYIIILWVLKEIPKEINFIKLKFFDRQANKKN